MHRPRVLATDLDGTFIPMSDEKDSVEALEQIRGHATDGGLRLVYVSGRHFEFVLDAILTDGLPEPDWILCDVGVSVYERIASKSEENKAKGAETLTPESLAACYRRSVEYDLRLDAIVGETDVERVRQEIAGFEHFRIQEPEKQARHKLSYYVPAEWLGSSHAAAEDYLETENLTYGIISSVDPFTGDGLVDVLPKGVSKAFALDWWCKTHGYENHEIVFCGDSGNDYAALVAGYRAVVVANADRALAARVDEAHANQGWQDRLFLATKPCTAGVLEGLRWFGWLLADANAAGGREKWGAVPTGCNETEFRIFAPAQDAVTLEIQTPDSSDDSNRKIEMDGDGSGNFISRVTDCPLGTLYQFRLGLPPTAAIDHRPTVADPASRSQPEGVHGRSAVVYPQFPWQHDDTPRAESIDELVIYELHIGGFTAEGTFLSAIDRLDELVDLGVTAIELMPIAQCPGRWNWGYDATHWFAPMNSLGTPEDLRRFVDAAHARGLHVFLDVVYNHFGPEGNYWGSLGNYFSNRHHTPWGASPNFDDGPESVMIRRFVIDNAIHWLDEYHLDGLRVDAIHCMKDDSDEHITRQFGREVRQWSHDCKRRIWLIAETNVYDSTMTVPLDQGGCGFDAQWGDDFAHALFACIRSQDQLTVRTYEPHVDLSRAVHRGFVFAGDVGGDRGREENAVNEPLNSDSITRVDTSSLVYCIQNHDFIGNHPLGQRLHQLTAPETQAAAASLLILYPAIPMLFMGEEFASEKPFTFFVDFEDEGLRHSVVEGRRRDYPQHDWSDGVLPTDESAFHSAQIGPVHEGNPAMRTWYRELIRTRRRFIETGLLSGGHLQTITDPDRGMYALVFRQQEEQLIVVVRLGEPNEATRQHSDPISQAELTEWLAIELPINGELPPKILDSRETLDLGVERADGLHINHAIVMSGLYCNSLSREGDVVAFQSKHLQAAQEGHQPRRP